MAQRYFWVKECPYSAECSAAAWKKAGAWGWTEDEARENLKLHLVHSGKHNLSVEEAEAAVEVVELEVGEHLEPQRKKQRLADVPHPGGAHMHQLQQSPPGGQGSSSSSGGIFVRGDILDALIDSCARASAAAMAAQRLCASAAQSFGDEANVMEAVKVRLKTMRDM